MTRQLLYWIAAGSLGFVLGRSIRPVSVLTPHPDPGPAASISQALPRVKTPVSASGAEVPSLPDPETYRAQLREGSQERMVLALKALQWLGLNPVDEIALVWPSASEERRLMLLEAGGRFPGVDAFLWEVLVGSDSRESSVAQAGRLLTERLGRDRFVEKVLGLVLERPDDAQWTGRLWGLPQCSGVVTFSSEFKEGVFANLFGVPGRSTYADTVVLNMVLRDPEACREVALRFIAAMDQGLPVSKAGSWFGVLSTCAQSLTPDARKLVHDRLGRWHAEMIASGAGKERKLEPQMLLVLHDCSESARNRPSDYLVRALQKGNKDATWRLGSMVARDAEPGDPDPEVASGLIELFRSSHGTEPVSADALAGAFLWGAPAQKEAWLRDITSRSKEPQAPPWLRVAVIVESAKMSIDPGERDRAFAVLMDQLAGGVGKSGAADPGKHVWLQVMGRGLRQISTPQTAILLETAYAQGGAAFRNAILESGACNREVLERISELEVDPRRKLTIRTALHHQGGGR